MKETLLVLFILMGCVEKTKKNIEIHNLTNWAENSGLLGTESIIYDEKETSFMPPMVKVMRKDTMDLFR